eukprot:12002532-Alexandrium_andersonii.AAC.2
MTGRSRRAAARRGTARRGGGGDIALEPKATDHRRNTHRLRKTQRAAHARTFPRWRATPSVQGTPRPLRNRGAINN